MLKDFAPVWPKSSRTLLSDSEAGVKTHPPRALMRAAWFDPSASLIFGRECPSACTMVCAECLLNGY